MKGERRLSKDGTPYSIFADRLQMRREALGFTQEAFAKSTKNKEIVMSKEKLAKYETLAEGAGLPYLATAIFLAKELKCSLDWLCGLTDVDTFNSGHTSSKSVENLLIELIAAILEDEIADFSVLVEDRTIILLENDLLDDFIVQYKKAIDFEDTAIKEFGDGSPFANKATEFKQEILVKYVEKYVEMKKGNNDTQQEETK